MFTRSSWTMAKVGLALLACPLLIGATNLQSNLEARLLASHNRERSMLGLPMLRWDPALASGARAWSDYLARSGNFAHSPNDPQELPIGENIWGGTSNRFSPEEMVGLWISEKARFRSGTFPAVSRTGNVADVSHYTQLVWRETSRVGCALSHGIKEDVLVCRYSNAGNVMGNRPY